MTASPRHTLPYDQPDRSADLDAAYLTIIEATSPYTGDEFLHEVAATTARALDVSAVFVVEIIDQLERARSIVRFADGEYQPAGVFGLGDSPAIDILRIGRSVHANGVQGAFPTNLWLKQQRAQAQAGVLLYSRSGDPIGILGLIHDTAMPAIDSIADLLERLAPRVGAELERRQRDIALRRSEARFRLLIEHSSDIMFYYRLQPDERFEYISPAVTKMVGWPPEAFFADAQLAIEVLDPEYRPLVLKAITTGSEEPIVARTTFAGGKAAWVEYRNFAFRNDEDNVIAVGGTIRDVTDRVQAEEDLARSERYRRALLEAAPDTIFRLDIDGQVLDYVPGEALTSVMASEPGGRRQGIADLVPLAYVAPARRVIQDAVRTGQVQRFEFESNAGGESRSYEARCIPFGDKEVLLIVRDFTAMKWHAGEADRMRLRDELDVKVEDKIRARNPYGLTYRELAVLHLVAEGSADKQIAEALGISIYTANKHVGNILGKMNAASRTEAGVRALREGLLG